ncbi:MAG: hypothetical protein JRI73_10900 [Deltaproteobacteria bacterium]|nr:hypothetical protein [Deltaproteobacteria bacterium]
MPKVIVIYHSQQFGDTKTLAEALAEGVRETGAEVEIISTNERRITLDEFLAADGVALGTPISLARSKHFSMIFICGTNQANLLRESQPCFSFPMAVVGEGESLLNTSQANFLSRWARQLRAGGQLATRRKNSAVRLAKNL